MGNRRKDPETQERLGNIVVGRFCLASVRINFSRGWGVKRVYVLHSKQCYIFPVVSTNEHKMVFRILAQASLEFPSSDSEFWDAWLPSFLLVLSPFSFLYSSLPPFFSSFLYFSPSFPPSLLSSLLSFFTPPVPRQDTVHNLRFHDSILYSSAIPIRFCMSKSLRTSRARPHCKPRNHPPTPP